MGSEMAARSVVKKVWALLRSNDTGVVLLLGLSFLFAIATVVREATPGPYERLLGDDLRFFFESFRILDLWFWLILLACVLLGLSLCACIVDRLAGRIRNGSRDPRDYGTILIHIGVGIALLGHLVGGLQGSVTPLRLDEKFRAVGAREVRVLDHQVETYRDGTLRTQTVLLESRDRSGRTVVRTCAPNAPASFHGGRELLLLLRTDQHATHAVLRLESRVDTLGVGDQRPLPSGGLLTLEQLFGPPAFRIPVARVRISGTEGAGSYLVGKGIQESATGIALTGVRFSAAAIVNYRRAPGTPWLRGALLVIATGCILLAARWLRSSTTGSGPSPGEGNLIGDEPIDRV